MIDIFCICMISFCYCARGCSPLKIVRIVLRSRIQEVSAQSRAQTERKKEKEREFNV